MPFCSFSDGAAMFDVTPIENMFLLEYLPTAPEGYLRVYLYARMLCLHPELGGEIGDVARALRMGEEDVFSAFSYWERQGLVERLSDRPPTYAIRPLKGGSMQTEMDRDYYKYREFNASMQDLFGAQLLHPSQYEMANDWLNVLGLSQEAVLKLLAYEIRRGSKQPAAVFKRANKRAAEWADRGIRTLEDVESAIAADDGVYAMAEAVLKQFAIHRKPTLNELDCARRWVDEWKLTQEDVLSACALTTKSRSPSIAYLDAILKEKVLSGDSRSFKRLQEVFRELGSAALPTKSQVQAYEKWIELGFEPESVELAAARCARKNWHSFERLEEMLEQWHEAGVHTLTQVELYLEKLKQAYVETKQLLGAAGLSRSPSADDIRRYENWKGRHAAELIHYAAQCSRGMGKPVLYMEKLLSEWEKSGVTTVGAAQAQHAQATEKKPAAQQGSPVNFQQRSYTKEESEKDYFDLEKFFAEEGDKV